MAVAGTLKITLTAEQAEFIEGMKKASDAVGKFAQESTARMSSFQKSMEHLAAGKHFSKLMGEIGGALGGNAHMITSAIRNFQHFGPAVGLAVTAIHAGVEAFQSHQEYVAKNAEVMAEYGRTLQEVARYEGDLFNPGKFERKYVEFAKKVSESTKQIQSQVQEQASFSNSLYNAFFDRKLEEQQRAQIALNQSIAKEAALMRKGRDERVTLDNPLKDFDMESFNIKSKGNDGTRRQMYEEYNAEMELVDKLAGKLETLKEGGEKYDEVLKEWQKHTLAAVAINDQLVGVGRAMTENLRTPIEKFKDDLKNTKDLLANGLITDETFKRENNKLHKELGKAEGAGQAAHLASATSFNAAVIAQLQHGGGNTQQQHLAIAQKQLQALTEIKKHIGKTVAVAGA